MVSDPFFWFLYFGGMGLWSAVSILGLHRYGSVTRAEVIAVALIAFIPGLNLGLAIIVALHFLFTSEGMDDVVWRKKP